MPISSEKPVTKLSQDQFGAVAYELMGHAFQMHKEMGRFFDEHVYRNELLRRFGDRAIDEFWINVDHGDFRKCYRVDLLIDGGAVFELKTVRQLLEIHRSQLIHYLMLLELEHGKLVNFRSDQVEHEFVNCSVTMAQRKSFEGEYRLWHCESPSSIEFQDAILDLANDWGTGLEAPLYEEAIMHRFGGQSNVERDIDVMRNGHRIGSHRARLIQPTIAFKVTSLNDNLDNYETHLRRLIVHTNLESVLWANITLGNIRFHEVNKKN